MKKRVSIDNKLAEERTMLSNERTLLSYVRTALTAILFGLALIQFAASEHREVAYIVILAGLFILLIGLVHFRIIRKKIKIQVGDTD